MSFSAASLRSSLAAHAPAQTTGWVVALSGGSDSLALLTALAEFGSERLPVRAIHIDHGLQQAAAAFRAHCEAHCHRLDVPLTIIAVSVVTCGASLEAAARAARYEALARELASGECLLTAHHAEDQAETLLLQLLRGAGLKGMAAMPRSRALGRGFHLRPLLEVRKAELRAFGRARGIEACADPMNDDTRFDRVYLRQQLWPALETRWPGAATALTRAARHAAEAQQLLNSLAARQLRTLRDGDALSVPGLRLLPVSERVNALRHWIAAHDVELPSSARLAEALRQILGAARDHQPLIVWDRHALRRYRQRVFLTAAKALQLETALELPARAQASVDLGAGIGRLRLVSQRGGLNTTQLPPTLSVRRHGGGETLKPYRGARTQTVQHLLQARGVLPWARSALPFVYAGDVLIAIGDLWSDARWCVDASQMGLSCAWENAPIIV